MTIERAVRLLGGSVVLISLGLGYRVSHEWLWLAAFAGVNLVQSAFTDWCPAMTVFRWMGLPSEAGARRQS